MYLIINVEWFISERLFTFFNSNALIHNILRFLNFRILAFDPGNPLPALLDLTQLSSFVPEPEILEPRDFDGILVSLPIRPLPIGAKSRIILKLVLVI